jgi:alpha-beta hydrolase superfamily lysophospholipase
MNDAPGPVAPTSTQTISGLYTETFQPPGTPKGIVVITHGYAEHCGRYHELANVIVGAGWAVLTYDCRGHGHSDPASAATSIRFATYLGDFTAMLAAAARLVARAPMVCSATRTAA